MDSYADEGLESPGWLAEDAGGASPPASPVGGGTQRRRNQVLPYRATGRITEWKGKFGWVQPDKPISHPEASKNRGRIYLAQDDVEAVISGVGSQVSFFVYADGTGLGAMNCVPAESVPAQKEVAKKVAPTGGTSQRKRIGNSRLAGQIKSWKGGFGFITPLDAVDHPLFTGSIFLHGKDIISTLEGPLEAGTVVSFLLYADPQGLGAEKVSLGVGEPDEEMPEAEEEAMEEAEPELPPPSPAPGDAAAALLKAKPKASGAPPPAAAESSPANSSLRVLKATPKGSAASAFGGASSFGGSGLPRSSVLKATPKAASVASSMASDPEIAKKMTEKPELARRLAAWIRDPGG